MDQRIKRQIISYARRISISWSPRVSAKNRAKVAPATYECAKCGKWCYEGTSEKNYQELCAAHPDKTIVMESIDVDHIVAVVDPVKGMESWDTFFERLFCEESNYRCLCPSPCHLEKSNSERLLRGQKPRTKPYKRKKKK